MNQPTTEEILTLVGDKEVVIYMLRKQIVELEKQLAQLTKPEPKAK